MTLPEYIASRREFDDMTVAQIRGALLKLGKIIDSATFADIEVACIEARQIYNLYLR